MVEIEVTITTTHSETHQIELPIDRKEYERLRENSLFDDYVLLHLSYQEFIEEPEPWDIDDYDILSIDDRLDEE